jgi:hypothetical protein
MASSALGIIDDVSSKALEGYAIDQGDPVSITSTPSGVVSTVGSPVAGSAGTLIIIVLIFAVLLAFRKDL